MIGSNVRHIPDNDSLHLKHVNGIRGQVKCNYPTNANISETVRNIAILSGER